MGEPQAEHANTHQLYELVQLLDSLDEEYLISKQKDVIDRLDTIRTGKRKLLDSLKFLLEKEMEEDKTHEQNQTQDLIHRLIKSYDGLKEQEAEFTFAMHRIIQSYYKIMNDIIGKLDALQLDENNKDELANMPDYKMLIDKIGMLKKLVTDIESMIKETEDASEILNDQLKTRLEIHVELKKKMLLINQLKKANESTSNIDKEKNVHQYVDTAGNSISDRKQRQLERLRKHAEKRGIVNNSENSSGITKPTKEQKIKDEQNEDEVRIPPIPKLPIPEETNAGKQDELKTKITERFASFENRKQRMQLLRSKLNNLQHHKMENTYEDALKRFNNLSEMRKQLEDIQITYAKEDGEEDTQKNIDPTDKDIVMGLTSTHKNDGEMEAGNSAEDRPDSFEDNRSSVSTNELINEVRRAFNVAFNKDKSMDSQTTGNMPGSSSFESAFSTLGDRLKTIENVLHSHTDQLIWIGNQSEVMENNQHEEQHQQLNNANELVEDDGIRIKSKQTASDMMECVSKMLDQEIEEDEGQKISADFIRRMANIIIDESIALCPIESHEKIKQSFPTIVDGVMSQYCRKEFTQYWATARKELAEVFESEFAFIFLIHNAKTLTDDEESAN